MTTLDLRTLRLRSGDDYTDATEIALEPFTLGGQRYLPVPDAVSAGLAITRVTSGTIFELTFAARVHGPCYRCLADAVLDVRVRAREYQATNPESDELSMPYLAEDTLDLSGWARDALALKLPDKILCRPECAGLCPVCGRDLNREPHEHVDEVLDPRWAALADLRDRL